jgi:cobalamin biosynthesis Mg chelatase CobN
MRNRLLSAIGLTLLLTAAPCLAQTAAQPASSSDQPIQHISGVIVSVSDTSLNVNAQPSTGSSPSATGATSQNLDITLNASTDKPLDLKAGDQVDIWYRMEGSDRVATRVAHAESPSSSSSSSTYGSASGSADTGSSDMSSGSSAGSQEPAANPVTTGSQEPQSNSQGAAEPAATGSESSSMGEASSNSAAQPANGSASSTATSGQLPKTASDLPLIGLIGLLALAGAIGLRLFFRD